MEEGDGEEDINIRLGMEFTIFKSLKIHVERYCVFNNFAHNKPANRRDYLKVVCTSHVDCPFELRGSRSVKSGGVRITYFNENHSNTHVAHADLRQRQPSLVSQAFLVEVARDCIASSDEEKNPKLVVTWARKVYGLTISRHAAWRALKELEEGSAYSIQKSYQYLQSYLKMFAAVNPGTVINFERGDDDTFKRLCQVFGTYNTSLKYCLPISAVDVCRLRVPDGGSLYVASTMTGAHDSCRGNSHYQCSRMQSRLDLVFVHLKQALPCIAELPDLFLISDRDKGVTPCARDIFPSVPHAACTEHIKRNVIAEFKTRFDGLIMKLAKETDKKELESIYEEIGLHGTEVVNYLKDVGDSVWLSAFFRVPRYGIVTSNSAEAINSSIGEFRKGSHLKVVVGITQMVMKRAFDVKQKYDRHSTMEIIPSVRIKLNPNKKAGRTREVVPQSATIFNVQRNNGLYRVVNLEMNICTCGMWVEHQFPCVHACAALQSKHLSVMTSVGPYYRYSCLQSILSNSMSPIDVTSADKDDVTLPPPNYKKAGRPKQPKRIRSRGEFIPEDFPIVCSRCPKRGPNIRTCERRGILQAQREARKETLRQRARNEPNENEHKHEEL